MKLWVFHVEDEDSNQQNIKGGLKDLGRLTNIQFNTELLDM